jgi:Calcineurin-like phosphoesterase
MKNVFGLACVAALAMCVTCLLARGQDQSTTAAQAKDSSAVVLRFAVSGDSRNCGDVVMPGLISQILADHSAFYWHLGDFRAIYAIDEDIRHQPEHFDKPMTMEEYRAIAWPDFLENQIVPFGSVPVFLGIGNHETIAPKTREELIAQIADWLDTPMLREQRLRDDPYDFRLKTYYHWMMAGADFINMDNASVDQFDKKQLEWFEGILARDQENADVKTIVVGMHQALPESISYDHSMNATLIGAESGRRVYEDLLRAQKHAHKKVYVLASHSHYYMENVYNTERWRTHGGVLPGWIIGTAGAVRYPLPVERSGAGEAITNVYGYLRAALHADGALEFEFRKLEETDIPAEVAERYTPKFVHWCFAENSNAKSAAESDTH